MDGVDDFRFVAVDKHVGWSILGVDRRHMRPPPCGDITEPPMAFTTGARSTDTLVMQDDVSECVQ